LALVALAGIPALFAIPPRGRPALGVLVIAVPVLTAAFAEPGADLLFWISVVALLVSGGLTAWRGRTWPAMGSRFGAATSTTTGDTAELWRELDRGNDPTDERPGSRDSADPPSA
jgi:hypothetical protein